LAVKYITLLLAVMVMQRHFAASYWRIGRRRDSAPSRRPTTDYRPSVDVIVPCFNEDPTVLRQCLESLQAQRYDGELRVCIVDDGSDNRVALQPIYDQYLVYDRWQLITLTPNRGKRRAQDEAVRRGVSELIVNIDSDTVLSPDGIRNIVMPFRHPRVGIATGNLRAWNRTTNTLTRLIDSRYRTLFEVERAAQSHLGSVLCCSGAFVAYRRSAIHEVWPQYQAQTFRSIPCTWGEDLHLTGLILAGGYDSLYEHQAVAQTVVPDTLKGYVLHQLAGAGASIANWPGLSRDFEDAPYI
jgi:N-acetylglucosaminyltransferase